ncbi:NAD(P)H dehydrogenase [Lentzea tibetensis]|uniref:FMN dependent NADH:quinone oxidoreductase n=1 Tax=Lentzea tibetensis TaxID=2591470 RepID=A0A563EK86_9PSEU|nr:NAD(P)H-dependent oxidoreductase [Lentzea tibetensis]TWP46944.1 NAD(P)H dehydrogenase [Lentzea tibetensis]
MSSLLHIDASVSGTGSVSRRLSAAFAARWQAAHPRGAYVHRDLAVDPVPHITGATQAAAAVSDEARTPEQRAQWTISAPLVDELRAASTLLLGVPMYNFSIPSTLKAWLDRVIIPAHMVDPSTGRGVLSGKKVVVACARGGSYAPGTPRAPFDFQEPYLRAVLSLIGLDADLSFVHAELTMAAVMPQMAAFRGAAAESLDAALRAVEEHAVDVETSVA